MKHKLRLLTILTLLLLVLLPVGTVWATCPPSPPQLYQGTVTVGGSLAVDGTSVTLWVGATQVDSTTTSGGSYGAEICTDSYGGQTVVFKVDGVYAAQTVCPASAGGPIEINLVITIVTEPDIWVSPTTKNFGTLNVGSSSSQTFTVGNNGDAVLQVSILTITGSNADQFAIENDDVSGQDIGPAGSETVDVVFSPTSTGAKTATLRIPSDDPDENPLLVTLRGRGSSAAPTPTPSNVLVQVAFLLDSSGSIGYSNWLIMLNGLADAVENSDCFPNNGSVELTVIRFSDIAQTSVGPVVITSGNAASVALEIRNIGYIGSGTCMACAFDEASTALKNSPNYSRSVKQAINLVTDGIPNCYECTVAARDSCIDNLDMTEAQDVICAEGIGGGIDVEFIRDELLFPQPGCEWPIGDTSPDCDGWIREVANAQQFADSVCEKLKVILVTPIECDFSATPTLGKAPLTVRFTDLSTGPVNSWLWDFGDGGTSTQQDPRHIYTQPGRYDVTLDVTDDTSECEITMENYIDVLPDMVTKEGPNLAAAYLLISPDEVVPNQEVEISINIGNDGGTTGTRSIVLYINGELEQSQTVSVSPGSAKLVVFTVTKSEPGTYQVFLEGNEGQFTVIKQANSRYFPGPLGTPGIIVIVVVAIILIGAIVFVFLRRE